MFTDGRALVTSRDAFWNESVLVGTRARIFQIELRPFTEEQRTAYAARRLENDGSKMARAHRIFDRLRQKTRSEVSEMQGENAKQMLYSELVISTEERIDLVPWVVMLATESADTDNDNSLGKYGKLLDGE